MAILNNFLHSFLLVVLICLCFCQRSLSYKLIRNAKQYHTSFSIKSGAVVDHSDNCKACEELNKVNPSINTFFVNKSEPISLVELSNENLVKIANLEATDSQCNDLCWKCLGYVYNPTTDEYSNENVFPKWKLKYPSPPDVIGITHDYDPLIDKPVRDASINLVRSIPRDFKGSVNSLKPYGFKGYTLKELTPNITRRAQLVSWLLYYKANLFGKSFEQLKAEREKATVTDASVEQLPSEKLFQQLRLDRE
eukprot:gene15211-20490_t